MDKIFCPGSKKVNSIIKRYENLSDHDEEAADREPNGVIRIDKVHVHKKNEENVLLSRLLQLDKGDEKLFMGQVALDRSHPFFFEHEYDHVPGLLIMEAARQFAVAVAHLFFKVPYGSNFILNKMESEFFQYASLDKPLFIKNFYQKTVFRKGQLKKMEMGGIFTQEGARIAEISGSWRMVDDKIMERLKTSGLPSSPS